MKKYGKIVDGKFIEAKVERIPLPNNRGYQIKWISDKDLASGEYKEIVSTADVTPQAESMVRAGRGKFVYEDIGEDIIRRFEIDKNALLMNPAIARRGMM